MHPGWPAINTGNPSDREKAAAVQNFADLDRYPPLGEGGYSGVLVLTMGMVRNRFGRWTPTDNFAHDGAALQGGLSIVLAAAQLVRSGLVDRLVVAGDAHPVSRQELAVYPAESPVYARTIRETVGPSSARVWCEISSQNTRENLGYGLPLLTGNTPSEDRRPIAVLSDNAHLDRVSALIELLPGSPARALQVVSAEAVRIAADPTLRSELEAVYATEGAGHRRISEGGGVLEARAMKRQGQLPEGLVPPAAAHLLIG